MIDTTTIENCVEMPEVLADRLTAFLERSPRWDLDTAICTAIAAFLAVHEVSNDSV